MISTFRTVKGVDFEANLEMLNEIADSNGIHYAIENIDDSNECLYWHTVISKATKILDELIKDKNEVKELSKRCDNPIIRKNFIKTANKLYFGGIFSGAMLTKVKKADGEFKKKATASVKKDFKKVTDGEVFYVETSSINELVAKIRAAKENSEQQNNLILRLLIAILTYLENNKRKLKGTKEVIPAVISLNNLLRNSYHFIDKIKANEYKTLNDCNYENFINRTTPLNVTIDDKNLNVLKLEGLQVYLNKEIERQLDLLNGNTSSSSAVLEEIKSRIKLLRLLSKYLSDLSVSALSSNLNELSDYGNMVKNMLKRYDIYLKEKKEKLKTTGKLGSFNLLDINSENDVVKKYDILKTNIEQYYEELKDRVADKQDILNGHTFKEFMADDKLINESFISDTVLEKDMEELENNIATLELNEEITA